MKGSVCAARVVSWIVLVGSYDPRNLTNQHEKELGTGSGSDRPECRVNSNFGKGPVAAAPGSIMIAVASVLALLSIFASASKAYRTFVERSLIEFSKADRFILHS